jgi:hypothetical protein
MPKNSTSKKISHLPTNFAGDENCGHPRAGDVRRRGPFSPQGQPVFFDVIVNGHKKRVCFMLNAKSTCKISNQCLPLRPKTLISFWEMVSVSASKVWAVSYGLTSCLEACRDRIRIQGEGSRASVDDRAFLTTALGPIESLCRDLNLAVSLSRLQHFKLSLIGELYNTQMITEIQGLQISIVNEAADRKLAFIPTNKVCFFEQETLFGGAVNAAFPSAAPEIKDAGNCLAAELDTAAVFHFMRVAEFGLRALARHLKVRVKGTVDYADWGTILAGIDRKLSALQRKPKGKKKSQELEFYRRVESECNALKDVWRNNVMHSRGRYNSHESIAVYLRVSEFMERLAARVTER